MWVVLTAQSGSSLRAPRSKRAPALANGAARRVRVPMEYFILIYIKLFFLFFVLVLRFCDVFVMVFVLKATFFSAIWSLMRV